MVTRRTAWQWGVLGALLVALAVSVSVFRPFRSSVRLASDLLVVDITTGDLYTLPLDRRRGIMIPAISPATGQPALLPVERRPDGKWYVDDLGRRALSSLQVPPAALVDRASGEVRVTSDTPRRPG